jgi:glyoxylate reductase
MLPHIFVTRQLSPVALDRVRSLAQLEVWPLETPPPHPILCEKAANAQGLITLLTDPIDAEVIRSGSDSLQIISQMAVGYDNIDLEAATQHGIPVGHTPGVLTETCADFTWALIMSAARRIVESDHEVRQGIWRTWGPEVLCGYDLYGATLGIIGFGRIGQAVARRAIGFNMQILYYDPQRQSELENQLGVKYVSMEELLTQSDFITLHTYLSESTRGLIGSLQFDQMKPNAILVNTSRGAIVDSDALVNALQNQQIAAAAVDVFDPEPIPQDHPLLQLPNLVVTPHIASASYQTRRKMAEIAVDNLLAGLRGETLPFCANPKVYGHNQD